MRGWRSRRVTTLRREDGGFQLPVSGLQVVRLEIDTRLGLLLEDGTRLTVEGRALLHSDERTSTIRPDEVESLSPALSLLHRVAKGAAASPRQGLHVAFENGVQLVVPPHDEHESWEAVAGDGTWRVISMPGGELATWA
jgi:hypothetical protein